MKANSMSILCTICLAASLAKPCQGANPVAPAEPAFLGVSVGTIPTAVRHHLAPPVDNGVVIEAIQPGSPAAAAGLEVWDVLLDLDGIAIASEQDLADSVGVMHAGDKVVCRLRRHGGLETVTVTLGSRPPPAVSTKPATRQNRQSIQIPQINITTAGGGNVTAITTGSFVIQDDVHSIRGHRINGNLKLTVLDAEGKTLFDGPADTEEQRARIPADVRKKLLDRQLLDTP